MDCNGGHVGMVSVGMVSVGMEKIGNFIQQATKLTKAEPPPPLPPPAVVFATSTITKPF